MSPLHRRKKLFPGCRVPRWGGSDQCPRKALISILIFKA